MLIGNQTKIIFQFLYRLLFVYIKLQVGNDKEMAQSAAVFFHI